MEEIKPLCYETICVGLRLYNTPLAPIIRKIPSAQDPPGRPILSPDPVSQSCPSRALRPHYLCSFRRPCRRGLVTVPTHSRASSIPTSAPDRADHSPEQPGYAGEAVQLVSWVGWPRLGVENAGPGMGGEKADWPPFSKYKMAFEYGVPHPHPSIRSAEHLPSFHPLEWGWKQGVGRRSPLR